ncbi:MAG TPA: hypothetical protein VOA80_04535 [Thermoanaerobaculia bacterium]|nr:hypothetical protein [Thermoanaerobaculia bacterium]
MSRIHSAALLACGLLTTPILAAAAAAQAQAADPMASCPLHAQHQAAAQGADVDERGDKTMGFAHTRTTHHFLLESDGGVIRVDANDAADTQSRDAIRQHLAAIARAFAAGDFASPLAIHDRVLPGIPEMTRLKARIHYSFEETDRGGELRITTLDPQALAAVHSFLRAQIDDHRTGDPTEPPSRR